MCWSSTLWEQDCEKQMRYRGDLRGDVITGRGWPHLTCWPDAHVLLSVQHEAAHWLPLRTVRRSLAHWRIKKKTWLKSNVDTRGRREKTHQTISDYPSSSPNTMSHTSTTHSSSVTLQHESTGREKVMTTQLSSSTQWCPTLELLHCSWGQKVITFQRSRNQAVALYIYTGISISDVNPSIQSFVQPLAQICTTSAQPETLSSHQ